MSCAYVCLYNEATQDLQLDQYLSQSHISAAGEPVVYGFRCSFDVKKLCQMGNSYFLPHSVYVCSDNFRDAHSQHFATDLFPHDIATFP